jgi:RimJ/RimL family protein N-acetyltransferase
MNEVTIETERLLLRMFCEDDFEDYATLCASPDVMRFLGGKPFSRVEAWRHMAMMIGHWYFRGYGYFAAEEKASGRFIGRVGFTNSAGWPGFELGWTIAPEFQGRRFATEGGRRLLQYAFEDLDMSHVISLIHRDNGPSIRVAERLGESLEGSTEVMGMPVLIYGIDRDKV